MGQACCGQTNAEGETHGETDLLGASQGKGRSKNQQAGVNAGKSPDHIHQTRRRGPGNHLLEDEDDFERGHTGVGPNREFYDPAKFTPKVLAARAKQRVKKEPFTYESKAVYSGQWVGKDRDGLGFQKWEDGAIYDGTFS
jgi:hypothetical protein